MRNLLRRLHLGPSQDDHIDHCIDGASNSRNTSPSKSHSNSNNSNNNSSSNKSRTRLSFPEAASGLLTVARNTITQSSNHLRLKKEPSLSESQQDSSHNNSQSHIHNSVIADFQDSSTSASASVDSLASSLALELKDSSQNGGIIGLERTQTSVLQYYSDQALMLQDEDLQVKVAMALSVRDDPEAAAIEAAKDLTRDSTPAPNSLTAEMLAYQYWKHNVLNYNDKVPDGFYDVYGVTADLHSEMPALMDLQEAPISEQMTSEVVLVNRTTDNDLVILEQKAVSVSLSSRVSLAGGWKKSGLINRLANLVVDHMGGPIHDSEALHKKWRTSCMDLRFSLGSSVLPLGCLHFGLERHRALLFKVLADAAGLPCRLVKGRKYTGSDERVLTIVKVDGGREYVVDIMLTPGKLVPFDRRQFSSTELVCKQEQAYSNSVSNSASTANNRKGAAQVDSTSVSISKSTGDSLPPVLLPSLPSLTNRSANHLRSPSWTEGITSQAVRDTKVKDVSQYMMNAAKENPMLAKKLHDFLIESGVQAPPELFSEISPKPLETRISQEKKKVDELQGRQNNVAPFKQGPGRPPAPGRPKDKLQRLNSVEGLGDKRPLDIITVSHSTSSSPNSSDSSCTAVGQSSTPGPSPSSAASIVQENIPSELVKHVPVAAAAAATAAVVASSMVVAASKSDLTSDPTLEVPVAAAATATAAVVVATSAVVGKRLEMPIPEPMKEDESDKGPEEERNSDKSSGSSSVKSDHILDDAAEWEIPWEDLSIGERIGLGSYGEVYRAEWHGTEVAVKKFLDQDLSGDALEEFRTEVMLMKRMRHPNVVLFMGAVMRSPNLSIVTEFLPRGSLYRLIHRANNQLDERRRLRMALDIARGMNYLHNSTPVIVHRDLKSPNLLVDKNWVVKVCDFGLSRMKHNTFLSSKSAVGTPEWMAPEVLRNEPSNEKADVYSFGVILWELATLQQPWAGMNPMQVVGAVGFQYRTLDLPDDLDPALVKIIKQCWQRDPAARPSFAEIMAALKPLQKPITVQPQKSSS